MSNSKPFDYDKENTAPNPVIDKELIQYLRTNEFEMLSYQIQV